MEKSWSVSTIKTTVMTIILSFVLSSLQPLNYTNKTYMSIPSPHYFLPMTYSCWHRILKQGSNAEHPWNATLQVASFYKGSSNGSDQGIYFGTNYKRNITIGFTTPEDGIDHNIDINTNLIVHRWLDAQNPGAHTPSSLKGIITLSPKHTTAGAYFSYHQKLQTITDGLFLEVNLPIAHVEHDPQMSISQETKDQGTNDGGTGKSIADFFAGTLTQPDGTNKQEALTHAKIDCVQSKTGIADLELAIGYRLAESQNHTVNGMVKVVLPTGNKSDGRHLFPAVVGNGHHWEVGTKLNGSMNILKESTSSLECLFHVEYAYVFSSEETRTLGYRQPAYTPFYDDRDGYLHISPYTTPWNYYTLGSENGKTTTFPLANILTRRVSVQPGNKLQGHASFAFHRDYVTFDFGYSFFAQEGEKVLCACWENNKYAPIHPTYDASTEFNVNPYNENAGTGDAIGGPIQNTHLDVATAATPGFLKHSIHGAVSFTSYDWQNPVTFGFGFAIDWTHDNSTAVGHMIWGKLGVSF